MQSKPPNIIPRRLAALLAPVVSFSFRLLFVDAFPLSLHERAESATADQATCSSETRPNVDTTSAIFWIKIVAIVLLVIGSGIVAGLTLGLMSLDEINLNILSNSGTPQQRKYAQRIIPIRRNGHLLLVTLLLTNTLINETLPVLFDTIFGGGVIAVVASTVLLVIFSEIIPQAVCSRYGLQIGAFFAWPVRVLTWVLFIVAYPIAKLLDFLLGTSHGMIYRRAELKELIAIHGQTNQAGGDLTTDAVTILQGALDMQEKRIRDAMTPVEKVFMLDYKEKLDRQCLGRILNTGHSRIPVYKSQEKENSEEDNTNESGKVQKEKEGEESKKATSNEINDKEIVGVLHVKSLVLLDPDDGIPLSHIRLYPISNVSPRMPLFDLLNTFQEGRSHMALVREDVDIPLNEEARESSPFNSIPADAQLAVGANVQPSNDILPLDAQLNEVVTSPEEPERSPRHFWKRRRRHQHERSSSTSSSSSSSSDSMELPPPEPPFNPVGRILGIITLEDVLEELIQEEIYDEADIRRLTNVAVRFEPKSGQRFVFAQHRLFPNEEKAIKRKSRRRAHRSTRSTRTSEETTRSLDEAGWRKDTINEEREREENEELEKEGKEKDEKGENKGEKEDERENTAEGGPPKVKRSLTDPGTTNHEELEGYDSA